VLELALEEIGHGLEAPVRMIGCAHRLARAVVGGPHLVEQQEGIDVVEAEAGEGAPHDEPASLPLSMRGREPRDPARACDGNHMGQVMA
jgi:hypothetical protein